MKNPSKWVYPKFISESGKKIWNVIVVKRKKDIRKFKMVKEQWAAALVIYKRSCIKNRIMPFTEESILSKTEIDKADAQNTLNILFLENKRANEEIETIVKGIEGHFRGIKQQTFNSVKYENGFYSVIFTRMLLLSKEVTASWFITYLGFKHGFSRAGRLIATKPIGRMTELVIKPDPKNKYQVIILVKAKLTRTYAVMLSGADDSLITKKLEKKMTNRFKSSKYPKRRAIVLGIVRDLKGIDEPILARKLRTTFLTAKEFHSISLKELLLYAGGKASIKKKCKYSNDVYDLLMDKLDKLKKSKYKNVREIEEPDPSEIMDWADSNFYSRSTKSILEDIIKKKDPSTYKKIIKLNKEFNDAGGFNTILDKSELQEWSSKMRKLAGKYGEKYYSGDTYYFYQNLLEKDFKPFKF